MSEQELIRKYFSRHLSDGNSVEVSVGDDAAIVSPPESSKLVITTDTLNVNVHFYEDCNAEHIGHKSLAVSLSDIAAMGALPLWATLSLSLPEIDHAWLEEFSNGFYALANKHNVKLVGGDLVRGPLSITVQVTGHINSKQALLRNGSQTDDLIYLSGYMGDAAMGLNILKDKTTPHLTNNDKNYFLEKLNRPIPRLDVSIHIADYASSAIDISDGFLIDLQRILSMSSKAAIIDIEKLPVSNAMENQINNNYHLDNLLTGGEDYELIFTIRPKDKMRLEQHFAVENILITEVGRIKEGAGITLLNQGQAYELDSKKGFDHFS